MFLRVPARPSTSVVLAGSRPRPLSRSIRGRIACAGCGALVVGFGGLGDVDGVGDVGGLGG